MENRLIQIGSGSAIIYPYSRIWALEAQHWWIDKRESWIIKEFGLIARKNKSNGLQWESTHQQIEKLLIVTDSFRKRA